MPFEEAVLDQPEQQTEETEVTGAVETSQEPASADATLEGSEPSQPQAEETSQDADWLPDEQLKVFPDEQYERYAEKRYPDLVALLKDGQTPEPTRKAVRQILHDKINSDIEIRRARAAGEETEAEPEEVEEQAADQPTVDPKIAQADWEQRVNYVIERTTDPEAANKFMGDFRKAFENKDPRQANIEATKVLKAGLIDALRDVLPEFLDGDQGYVSRIVESRYEGLGDTVQQTQFSRAWNDLAASNPVFKELPAYDPKPNSPWSHAIAKVAELVPGFEKFSIPGASTIQNFQAKATIAAKLLSQGVNPNSVAVAQKAVETGKRIAKESERNKNLGKLGAGQSKGQLSPNSKDDDLKQSIARLREESSPFAGMKFEK